MLVVYEGCIGVSLPVVVVLLVSLVYSLVEMEVRWERRRQRRILATYILHHGEEAFIKVSKKRLEQNLTFFNLIQEIF